MSDITWTNCTIKLGELKPWADNPRTSTKAQAKRILRSFEQFNQVVPIAIGPNFEVYDGHQRLSALLTVHGPSFEVEARQASKALSDDERRGLVLALANATGSWSWDQLSNWNTETLTEWGFDKDTLKGWKSDVTALGEFLKSEAPAVDAEPQTDRAAELLEKWGVKLGDLWQIGDHRLICGDCTDAATVARVMDGEKIDLLWTDPPYGIGYQSESHDTENIQGDDKDISEFVAFIDDLPKETPIYICCDFRSYPSLYFTLESKGRKVAALITWDKTEGKDRAQVPPSALDRWIKSTEFIAYCGKLRENFGYSPNIIHYSRVYGQNSKKEQDPMLSNLDTPFSLLHPTIKPLILIEKCVKAHDGIDVVYDPYVGSGSTLVACENLRRRCRAIEISPAYVAVALERMATAFPALDIRRVE